MRRSDPLLIEVAWETCNQVGGIYTVLRSKVPSMIQHWSKRYCLVGPYEPATAQVEFEPGALTGVYGQAVKELREQGVDAHFGRWLVTGRPQVVLLDYRCVLNQLHEIKYRLWKDHHIETPASDPLIDPVVAFGELVQRFLGILAQRQSGRRALIGHFHEWMAGAAIPMLRQQQWPGSVVFTTHATMLGRYLAMNDPRFYEHLPFYDPAVESARFNVEPQFQIERAAAHGAQVFTTVSDVTAQECGHLLGRQPDVVLPNGLNIQRFERLHELQILHRKFKQKIHEFTMGHFFPSYSFDLDKTLYFYTSGRYEYRNKGMDMTIDSLVRLNQKLKATGTDKTIVAFIITRRPTKSINVQALQTRAMLDEFRAASDTIKNQLGDRLMHAVARGHIPDMNTLVDDYWKLRMRRSIHAWKRSMPPTIVTHDLIDDQTDEVLNQLRAGRLWNQKDDPVKVVYHPDFINPTSPLWRMDYDQFVRGCHVGIFPSYYEPWGYTPLESIALGVPAATSDLSGFGSYVQQLLPEEKGLYTVRRKENSFEKSAQDLADWLFSFTLLGRRERISLRNSVENFALHFDWHNLSKHYDEAHEMALSRT